MPSEDSENYIWLACSCDGQFLERDDDITIVRGQVAKILVTFTTSTEWDDTKILARFKNDATVYDIYLEDDGSVTIPHEITDIVSTFQIALYGETPEGRALTSTPITVNVIETIFHNDLGQPDLGQPDPPTPSILSQILNSESGRVSAEAERAEAEQNRASAEITRQQEFEEAIANAEEATGAANTAANAVSDLANSVIPLVSVDDEDLIHVTNNNYGTNIQEVRVYGSTRQNLWANPIGEQGGVTVAGNEDGSFTLSGQNTLGYQVNIYATSYVLKRGAAYHADSNATPPSGVEIRVTEQTETDAYITHHTIGASGTSFSVSDTCDHVRMSVYVASGSTASGTYRVMLNEGSEPQPWCPPGLTSVSELSVVSAGKNLLSDAILQQVAASQSRYVKYADGVMTVNANNSVAWGHVPTVMTVPPGDYGISFAGNNAAIEVGNGTNFVATSSGTNFVHLSLKVETSLSFKFLSADAATFPVTLTDIQLELGSSATAYEPPHVTTTPIDLSGHELHSLPDGTCDVLIVRSDGSAEIEAHVGVVDHKNSFSIRNSDAHVYAATDAVAPYQANYDNVYSNTLAVSKNDITSQWSNYSTGLAKSETIRRVYIKSSENENTVEELKSTLESMGGMVLYPLKEPYTITLPSVSLPNLPKGEFNVWASSEVPATIDLTYSWDANAMQRVATTKECTDMIKNLFVR